MKPLGVWSFRHGVPSWAWFAQIVAEYVTDDDLRWAAAFAAGRAAAGAPFAWVLALTGPSAFAPMGAWFPAVAARVEASGLLPYIGAISYREEVYGGQTTIAEVDEMRDWRVAQHAVIRQRWPWKPIVGIEQFWCPTTDFGAGYYRPDYGQDIRAIEAYVPKGETWHSALLDPKLALACGESVAGYRMTPKPVVLISQAFRGGTGEWSEWPTPDTVAHSARWLQHASVIAHWPFSWETERNGDVIAWEGWADWPERHLLSAWGIR